MNRRPIRPFRPARPSGGPPRSPGSPPSGAPGAERALDPSGLLVVDKPAGLTSHDVVDRVRAAFDWKKVGHAGTLDPLATGILVLLVGKATKSQATLLNKDKEYRGTLKLGAATTTHDAEGEVVRRVEGPLGITSARLEEAMGAFRGEIRQLPPMVSAVKHKGKPLYKYARKGVEVPREERAVTVHRLDLLELREAEGEADILCVVSKGTYVRTLVHDLGERLGCGAYLLRLRRTRLGPFGEEDARPLDGLLKLGREEAFYLLRPVPGEGEGEGVGEREGRGEERPPTPA